MALEYNNEKISDIAHLIDDCLDSYLQELPAETEFAEIIYDLIDDSYRYNPWFIKEHMLHALKILTKDLETFVNEKMANEQRHNKTILVLLRTNAPFEGIAELIYLAQYFDKVLVQALPELQWYFRKCLDLFKLIPHLRDTVSESTGSIGKIDCILAFAPLSDTAIEYFKKYPSLQLYSHGYSILLTGEEDNEDIKALVERCCIYFGRGGMNIRKLYVPENYKLARLCPYFEQYSDYLNHHKYYNNYEYRKSSMILNKIPYTECGPVLLCEDNNQIGYTGVLVVNSYAEIKQFIEESNPMNHEESILPVLRLEELKNSSIFTHNMTAIKSFIERLSG